MVPAIAWAKTLVKCSASPLRIPQLKKGEKKPPLHVWQNSWGLSTRVIGVMVMIHGDDRGLVLPPRVVETQVIIIPVGVTAKSSEEEKSSLHAQCEALAAMLRAVGVRVEIDQRDGYSPGYKFNDWEQKGVPLRLEFGPGEIAGHFVTTSRRDVPGKEGKGRILITELDKEVPALLDTNPSGSLSPRGREVQIAHEANHRVGGFRAHTQRQERYPDPALLDGEMRGRDQRSEREERGRRRYPRGRQSAEHGRQKLVHSVRAAGRHHQRD